MDKTVFDNYTTVFFLKVLKNDTLAQCEPVWPSGVYIGIATNLKQNEAQSACAESTNKGVNYRCCTCITYFER